MTQRSHLLALALFLLPLPGLLGQDAALKDTFSAAKSQWAMQGDRDGAAARFESVLAVLEPKASTLDEAWRQILCETYNWLAVLEDRVPGKRPQAAKRLETILELNPNFELDRALTNARLTNLFETTRTARFSKLVLALTPEDGELSLDGKPLHPRRPSYYLAPGNHLLRYARPGFTPQEHKLELAPKGTRTLPLSLARTSSTVRVNTHPVGAEVLLDGKSAGVTRGQAPATLASWAEKLGLTLTQLSGDLVLDGLAPGRHRIEIKAPCFKARLLELDESFATPFADHTLEPVKLASSRGSLTVDSLAPGGVLTLGTEVLGPLPIKELPVCPGLQDLRVDYPEGRFSARIEVLEGKALTLKAWPRPRIAFLGFEGSLSDRERLLTQINRLGSRLLEAEFIPSVPGENPKAALERLKTERGAELTLLARPFEGHALPEIELVLATQEGHSESLLIKPMEQDPLAAFVEHLNHLPSLKTPWVGLCLLDLPGEPGPWPLLVEPEAEKLGIKPRLPITHLNGEAVATVAAFQEALGRCTGELVTLTQGGVETKVPLTARALALPIRAESICYPLALMDLRLRYASAQGDEAGFIKLNLALAEMHFRHYGKALEALRDAKVGATAGVSQGTIDYYRGVCLNSLGMAYAPEASLAWKQAAQSPGATLLGPEGPSVRLAATQSLESLNP